MKYRILSQHVQRLRATLHIACPLIHSARAWIARNDSSAAFTQGLLHLQHK